MSDSSAVGFRLRGFGPTDLSTFPDRAGTHNFGLARYAFPPCRLTAGRIFVVVFIS